MKERFDENGNQIGDGATHCTYRIEDFGELPVRAIVSESYSTESVYVTYTNLDTLVTVKVRFSSHICNDVKFGAAIDGNSSDARNEILYRLGFIDRVFVPAFVNHINTQYVAKKKLNTYEEADKTIAELIALPAGTDISEYRGKLAKGSTMLITSDKVLRVQRGGYFKYNEK